MNRHKKICEPVRTGVENYANRCEPKNILLWVSPWKIYEPVWTGRKCYVNRCESAQEIMWTGANRGSHWLKVWVLVKAFFKPIENGAPAPSAVLVRRPSQSDGGVRLGAEPSIAVGGIHPVEVAFIARFPNSRHKMKHPRLTPHSTPGVNKIQIASGPLGDRGEVR